MVNIPHILITFSLLSIIYNNNTFTLFYHHIIILYQIYKSCLNPFAQVKGRVSLDQSAFSVEDSRSFYLSRDMITCVRNSWCYIHSPVAYSGHSSPVSGGNVLSGVKIPEEEWDSGSAFQTKGIHWWFSCLRSRGSGTFTGALWVCRTWCSWYYFSWGNKMESIRLFVSVTFLCA